MANIPSQEKRILRAERERFENRRYTSAIKTYFRRLQTAVGEGDDETADAEHRQLSALIRFGNWNAIVNADMAPLTPK